MSDARDGYAFTSASENRVEHIDVDGNKLVLRGTFDVEGGIATGGTVTGFDVFAEDGTKVMKARGFDFDLKDVDGAYFGNENGDFVLRAMFWEDSDSMAPNTMTSSPVDRAALSSRDAAATMFCVPAPANRQSRAASARSSSRSSTRTSI